MVVMRNQTWDVFGNLLKEEIVDERQNHLSLDVFGVIATLNAVLGIWTLEDAANAVGLSEQDLVAEAQAWAVGQRL